MRHEFAVVALLVLATSGASLADDIPGPISAKEFLAGAAEVDVSPSELPVIVNCMFNERTGTQLHDPLKARALVLDDGSSRIAIVIVDSCMMPRELTDHAKGLANKATDIPVDRILIAATHTHSAPAAMGCLGSDPDPQYIQFLAPQLARAIELAVKNMQPARIGWSVVQAPEYTHCRRWILRTDKVFADPFGNATVRANMHPGYQNPSFTGPSGPVDAGLSVLSIQSAAGRPLALLANYSMHYFGSQPLSADYFGVFAEQLRQKLAAENGETPFIGFLSQGTSGDQMWMDYGKPQTKITIEEYTQGLVDLVAAAQQKIEHCNWVPLAMEEAKITLERRLPDEQRTAWAENILEQLGDRKPTSQQEIYAREAMLLVKEPKRELNLQAIRIGELGITAIPNEVFALTGLKIKEQSPLQPTFNIELANGAEGYIPPPEQHKFGGYTTWPARTAGLSVEAEPKIVETLLTLLEQVSGKPRRGPTAARSSFADAVLASKPFSYWRFEEITGAAATDASGNDRAGKYEDLIAFYLDGPSNDGHANGDKINRAAHFAGGRVRLPGDGLRNNYSVELWLYNALPTGERLVTGYAFSRGRDGDKHAQGEHLGIGGTHAHAGKLIFFNGNELNEIVAGQTVLEPKVWHHIVLVRDGEEVRLYSNGRLDGSGTAKQDLPATAHELFIGGRNDNFANFEGKLDEAAIYNRALSTEEIAAHFSVATGRAE